MFIIQTLRHNAYKAVDIPRASDLYKRYGFGKGTEKSSGEEFLDPSLSKVDMAASVQKDVDKASVEMEKAADGK